MSIFHQFIIAVRFVGLKATLRTILYAIYRTNADFRFLPKTKQGTSRVLRPERMDSVTTFHAGALFRFTDDIYLEVTFISPHTVRVTWQPGMLPMEFAVERDLTVALQVETRQEGDHWQLSSGEFSIHVYQDGAVQYLRNGKVFRRDDPPVYKSPGWQHQAPLTSDAKVFGLGEQSGFQLRPGKYRLWNNDIGGSYGPGAAPLYVNMPVFFCHQKQGSYLIFYENSWDGSITFDDHAQAEFLSGALRVYVTAGGLAKSLEEYTRLTGRPPMPPRWALGFHQCRWGYATEQEVLSVLDGFKKHDLPLDVFHLDIDHMDDFRVFTVDKQRFPHIKDIAQRMADEGIKLVTIIDPGVKIDPDYHVYRSGLELDAFCKLPDGSLFRGLVWPGWVHFPDFSNQLVRMWWGELYRPFLEQGVDGFWHDMNEPSCFAAFGERSFPRSTRHFFNGRDGNHIEGHNLYGALMAKAGFEGLRRIDDRKRPWLLTRSGWAGVQRYAWKWTGDVESTWAALKMTIGEVLGSGVSGIAFNGSDIGGFTGSPDADLFTRWFQMSAFMAFFRNHAALGTPPREPWQFGEPTLSICRDYLNLRKSLSPYFYTLAWEAHKSGAPAVRLAAWIDENDLALWDVDDEFMLGDSFLVAPVVEPGAKTREVVFPKGRWYSFWDDAVFEGPARLEVKAPLERIPVFVREGAVIPMQEESHIVLHYYLQRPEAGDVLSLCYTDEGDGYGDYRLDTFTSRSKGGKAEIIRHGEGNFQTDMATKVVVHGGSVSRLWTDGDERDWTEALIGLPQFSELRFELRD